MLLAIVLCTTVALTIANPFHKYPYVFLLDVGNEELEKINTEQLRVSIPGGSLAMKYPVMGEGDTISHVRVSGIDFGTDLKVNIVDGGPGYKYVVLVFMGNPGVSYDAVVTLQTLPNGTAQDVVNRKEIFDGKKKLDWNSYEATDSNIDVEEEEEPKDGLVDMKKYSKMNKEVMQESSTFYKYAKDEKTGKDGDEESENISAEEHDDDDNAKIESGTDHDDDDLSKDEEESESSSEEVSESSNEADEEDDEDISVRPFYHNLGGEAYYEANESIEAKIHKGQIEDQFNDVPRVAQYTANTDNSGADSYRPANVVDDSLYDKYQDLKPHFANGFRVYPQSFIFNKQYQVSSGNNKEDPVELEQMFNDEEVHNDARFKDGSNSIDPDYVVAEY